MKLFARDDDDDKRLTSQARREARQFLPSSAKTADAQRLNVFNPDEELDETTDEDLAFLNALVADVPEPAVAPLRRQEEPAPDATEAQSEDDLDVFRELASLRQRSDIARQLRVDDVEMGDLLEQLHTTRAALRHHLRAA